MKKRITIGALLVFAAVLAVYGKESERPSGAADNSGADSVGETKVFTLPGGVHMEMVYVAPGSFQMGSENGVDDEKPVHKVTLTNGYWIGKYPVTQAQWNALVSAMDVSFDGGRPVAFFSRNGIGRDLVSGLDTSDFPMENISWNDCTALVAALNKEDREGWRWSLPTEAQWEYACRAGSTEPYAGDGYLDDMGWYDDNCDMTHPVGQKRANAWGFHDTHGNVWEWCADWYGEYGRPATDPRGPASGKFRVLRGGSWSRSARGCRSAYRGRCSPDSRVCSYGLRLCCSAEPRSERPAAARP